MSASKFDRILLKFPKSEREGLREKGDALYRRLMGSDPTLDEMRDPKVVADYNARSKVALAKVDEWLESKVKPKTGLFRRFLNMAKKKKKKSKKSKSSKKRTVKRAAPKKASKRRSKKKAHHHTVNLEDVKLDKLLRKHRIKK